MSKEKLKELSIDQLKKKEKSLKIIMIGIFIPLIVGLFFVVIRDYFNDQEIDWPILTIAICTLAGPTTLYSELKEVQKELIARD